MIWHCKRWDILEKTAEQIDRLSGLRASFVCDFVHMSRLGGESAQGLHRLGLTPQWKRGDGMAGAAVATGSSWAWLGACMGLVS